MPDHDRGTSMIKRIRFVQRHPDLGIDEFHDRWRGPHAEMVAANPAYAEHLLRYEQNHRTPRDYERADVPYDGVAIQWFDSWSGFLATQQDPRRAPIADDMATLFAPEGVELFTAPEQVVIPGPAARDTKMTKLVCAVRRKPGMDVDEFHRYWWEEHGALNRETPDVARWIVRYEQNHRLAEDYGRHPDCEYDGCTIEWFRSARDFFGMATDPVTRDTVRADEERFLDTDRLLFLLTGPEEVVLDRR